MKILKNLVRLLFPPVCLLCGEIMGYGTEVSVCDKCASAAGMGKLPVPMIASGPESPLDKIFSVYPYAGVYRTAVHMFKYRGIKRSGPFMAELMREPLNIPAFNKALSEYDVLVPVPLHKRREFERGFNQAGVLAECLSGIYNKPVTDCAKRVKYTKPLIKLTPDMRRKVIKSAFRVVRPSDIKGKNVFIIDDVFTTGATTEELAKTLIEAGAGKVSAITFCKAGLDAGRHYEKSSALR